MAELIIPWKGVSTSATGLDELIELISLAAPRGFLRFATSWSGHSNGYSGFCSRAGYGTQEGDIDRISGVIFVSSDAVYAFVADIKLDTREVSNIKKAKIAWT